MYWRNICQSDIVTHGHARQHGGHIVEEDLDGTHSRLLASTSISGIISVIVQGGHGDRDIVIVP